MSEIHRGDIWVYDPDPVKGNEIGKKLRPCLIISSTHFNRGRAEIVIVVPLTTKDKNVISHVKISPDDGSVKETSFAITEQVRSISKTRLIKKWGTITNPKIFRDISRLLVAILQIEY